MVEELDGGHAASEPFGRGEADDEGTKDVLDLFVIQTLADCRQRSSGLLTNDGLIGRCKNFKEGEEGALVWQERPNFAKLLSDSKEHLIVLISNQS